MAQQALVISDWSGGIARFKKKDIPFSFSFIEGLNPYEDPSQLVPFPKPTKVSGSTVTALPTFGADGSPWDTNRYFTDEDGNIYRETSGGTWSVLRSGSTIEGNTGDNANGQGLLVFNDYLYYATETTIGRYGPLSGTPAFNDTYFEDGVINLDQSNDDTGQTYSTTTGINEGATHRQTFVPTYDTLKTIEIHVNTVGTGDWTVTVHDSDNTVVGTATIANGSVTTNDNSFTFSTPLRVTIGNSYHFHVTTTVADGAVTSGTSSDLEDCDFHTYFGILVSSSYHQMVAHDDGSTGIIVIANERYLATWDEDTYRPNKIIFPPGETTRTLHKENEFVLAGTWQGDTLSKTEKGNLYYWDGIGPTLNYPKPVPIGAPNALTSSKNRTIGVYGTSGEIYMGTEPFQRINGVPKLSRGKTIEVLPAGIGSWQGLTMLAFGVNTDDSSTLKQGIYAWGNKDDKLPEVLSYVSPVSTGTKTATTLEIGMTLGVGDEYYYGWRDDSTYGVDKISKTGNPVTSGTLQSLLFDAGNPKKDKIAQELVITFEPLESGETVTPIYDINRSGTYSTGDTVSTVGATQATLTLYQRFKEISIGFNWTTSTTFLVITGMEFMIDDCREELSL